MAVSYDRTIPRGGEGKIKIKVNTEGYGGKTLLKTALVRTDDPASKTFRLHIEGPVEKLFEVSDQAVHLDGKIGQKIAEVVTVRPVEKFGHRILSGTVKKGENMEVAFLKDDPSESAWKISIRNTAQQAGRYYDVITLKTDSDLKPELKIRVFGHIRDEKTALKSGP